MRPLLLCGASVRSLAQSAIRAGWQPWCIDFFADADLRHLLHHHGGRMHATIASFQEIPNVTAAVDSGIPLVWGGGLENAPDVLQQLALQRPVLSADPASVARARDLQSLHPLLRNAGVQCPRTLWEPESLSWAAALKESDPQLQWLMKPVGSAGGTDVAPVGDGSDASDDPCAANHVTSRRMCVQQRVQGSLLSALLIADSTSLSLVGCSLQLAGWPSLHAAGFRFCGNLGPVNVNGAVREQIVQAARAVVELTGIRGAFGLDLIIDRGQAWLLEVNPRLPASHEIYELTGCVGLFADHVRACVPLAATHANLLTDAPAPGTDPALNLLRKTSAARTRSTVLRMIVYGADTIDSQLWSPRQNPSTWTPRTTANGCADVWMADIPFCSGEVTPIAHDSVPAAFSQAVATDAAADVLTKCADYVPVCSLYVGVRTGAVEPRLLAAELTRDDWGVRGGAQLEAACMAAAAGWQPLNVDAGAVVKDLRSVLSEWQQDNIAPR